MVRAPVAQRFEQPLAHRVGTREAQCIAFSATRTRDLAVFIYPERRDCHFLPATADYQRQRREPCSATAAAVEHGEVGPRTRCGLPARRLAMLGRERGRMKLDLFRQTCDLPFQCRDVCQFTLYIRVEALLLTGTAFRRPQPVQSPRFRQPPVELRPPSRPLVFLRRVDFPPSSASHLPAFRCVARRLRDRESSASTTVARSCPQPCVSVR